MPTVRIAQAQVNPTVGDLAGNAQMLLAALGRAREAGADVVTFPELALCGYPPEDLLLKPHFLRDCRKALDTLTAECAGIAALVGFPDADGDGVYNGAALLHDRKLVAVYHKVELPNYGVFDEKRYFRPGAGGLAFELAGLRLLVTICEDVWVSNGLAEHYALRNQASVTLNLSASPFHAGKLATRREVLAGFARRTHTFVCYNNLVGGQDELVFDGGSLVVGPDGALVASAARFEADLLVTDLVVAENGAAPARQATGQWGRRLVLAPRRGRRRKLPPPALAPELDRIGEIYQALVLGTRDYVRKNGFRKVALGLSGGIDSSLTAAIAVEAVGADNVIGVTMPSHITSRETLADAALLAGNLGIALLTLPIKGIFDAYLAQLEEPLGPGEPGIERENLQARIRGNILMALSNRFGWLVLTTGNKSEIATGYCTLYGDTAGGFAVIKDVPKTTVYELAELVNRKAGREVIPRSVIQRPPTAELKPNQRDEDSLPPYAVLDPIIRAYVEDNKAPEELAELCPDPARLRDVLRRVDRSEYKRRQAPPGIKITPRAFGRDWRLPITNRYGNGALAQPEGPRSQKPVPGAP